MKKSAELIGVDLAKSVFHIHGAKLDGEVVFRKKLSRGQFLKFFARHPNCVVAMEACASSHHWARQLVGMGYEVKLIPPQYVKPFVKRQKNDANDAEAIVEAASRRNMRFVGIKSEEQQAQGSVLKVRDLLQSQRTKAINALRGHLAEFGLVAPVGPANIERLLLTLEHPENELPDALVEVCRHLGEMIHAVSRQIADLTKKVERMAKENEVARRLTSIPGVGPIGALAIATLAPPPETFTKGRDFSAWLGLTPKQHSTGDKSRLGKMSKMGQSDISLNCPIGADVGHRAAVAPAGSRRQKEIRTSSPR